MTTTLEHADLMEPETLDRETAELFKVASGLPQSSADFMASFTTSQLLNYPFVDYHTLAVLKRLSEDDTVDDQLLIDTLAYALLSDDPFMTSYNALLLLGYLNEHGLDHGLDAMNFASAVAGLSHHHGERGSESMYRLCDPVEIAGAAAVIIFIGTMDRNKLVKLSTLKHPESSGKFGLTISNGHLDRLLRSNPQHLGTVCNYLMTRSITTSKKSVQPLVDHLRAGGATVLVDGSL